MARLDLIPRTTRRHRRQPGSGCRDDSDARATDDPCPPSGRIFRRTLMLDIAMLALTFGFFIVGILYVLGCERL